MSPYDLKPALVVAVLVMTGCSGPTQPVETAAKPDAEKAEQSAPAQPVTAKTAYWEMYKVAHAWATDLQPLTLEAKTLSGIKNEGGKAAMWESTFGSPSKKQYSKFTYAVASRPPDIRKGVIAAEALPWAGPNRDAMTFTNDEFTVDSDAAYKSAEAKAGAWLKQNPDKELTSMSLGAASRFPGPVWYFLWGEKKAGYFVLVSANTGQVLK